MKCCLELSMMSKDAFGVRVHGQRSSLAHQKQCERGFHGAIWSTPLWNVPAHPLAARAAALLVRAARAVLSLARTREVIV